MAKKLGLDRYCMTYKFLTLGAFFLMAVQAILSVFSLILLRIGVKALYRPEALSSLNESDLVVSYSDESCKESANTH